jgi:WD40 repeat protein
MERRFSLIIIFLVIIITSISQSAIAAQEFELFVPLDHHSLISSFAFSPDHKYVLSGSSDKSLKLWDVKSGRQIRTFWGHGGYIDAVFFFPDSRYALSGTRWQPVAWGQA